MEHRPGRISWKAVRDMHNRAIHTQAIVQRTVRSLSIGALLGTVVSLLTSDPTGAVAKGAAMTSGAAGAAQQQALDSRGDEMMAKGHLTWLYGRVPSSEELPGGGREPDQWIKPRPIRKPPGFWKRRHVWSRIVKVAPFYLGGILLSGLEGMVHGVLAGGTAGGLMSGLTMIGGAIAGGVAGMIGGTVIATARTVAPQWRKYIFLTYAQTLARRKINAYRAATDARASAERRDRLRESASVYAKRAYDIKNGVMYCTANQSRTHSEMEAWLKEHRPDWLDVAADVYRVGAPPKRNADGSPTQEPNGEGSVGGDRTEEAKPSGSAPADEDALHAAAS